MVLIRYICLKRLKKYFNAKYEWGGNMFFLLIKYLLPQDKEYKEYITCMIQLFFKKQLNKQ